MGKPLDIVIRGDGITGCALALALAPLGLRMGLVAGPTSDSGAADVRAYSLNATARQLLQSLHAWPDAAHTGEVRRIAVQGDAGGQIEFSAQAGQALSWIVDVPALQARLRERVRALSQLTWLSEPAEAELTVICEGRASTSRDGWGEWRGGGSWGSWGVEFERQPYGQSALAFRVWHEQEHLGCARQRFSGVDEQASILALLPLADAHQSAVVWSLPAQRSRDWRARDEADLAHELTLALGHELGAMRLISERSVWPLQSAQARQWSGRTPDGQSFVLVGDAAHIIHPLAGLGLNLGLDDVRALSQVLARRHPDGRRSGVGEAALLRHYERQRKLDVGTVNAVCDGLQVLFSHPAGLARWMRNAGLSGVDRLGFLKQWIMARATHLESGV